MSFFARIVHVIAPELSTKGTYVRPRPQNWTRPKTKEKQPALDELEFRQTVSDTFFVSLQMAGVSLVGNIAAEKARDPFGLTNTLDMSVGGESQQSRAGANRVTPPQSLVLLADGPDSNGTRASGVGRADRDNSTSSRLAESKSDEDLASARENTLPEGVDSSAIRDVAPRPHGVIRKLKLAPPAFAVGASATFVADAAPTSQVRAPFEIPKPAEPPAAAEPVPAAAPRPNIPAPAGGGTDSQMANAPTDGTAQTPTSVATDSVPENASPPSVSSSVSPAERARGFGEGDLPSFNPEPRATARNPEPAATTVAGDSISSQDSGGTTLHAGGPPPCVQSGPHGQSGGGPPVVPGPPCTPPGQQTSSLSYSPKLCPEFVNK